MRVGLALLSLLSVITFVAGEAAASPQTEHRLRQVTRRELVARAKYPDHFGRHGGQLNRRDGGEGQVEPPTPQPSGGPTGPCPLGELNGPGAPSRRREFVADQVLSPTELVAFLKGRGEFVSDNGTVYVDDHFKKTLLEGREHATRFPGLQRVYRRVKDKVGTTLLSMSIPGYRRWKEALTPGDIFWLSSKTYIRHEDISEIERLLLEDQDWTEIELHGFHISRSWIEAIAAI